MAFSRVWSAGKLVVVVVALGATYLLFAAAAARVAMARAGCGPDDIDLIICATVTPDFPFPSTACLVQNTLGATRASAFDISAACSGFLYGLAIADKYIATGAASRDQR